MGRLTAAEQRTQRAEAIETLKKFCPRGSQIFTIQRGVNSDGDRWKFDLYAMRRLEDGSLFPYRLNSVMRETGLYRQDANGHLIVNGGGMDMSHDIVHSLSLLLYGKDEAGKYDAEGAQSLKRERL